MDRLDNISTNKPHGVLGEFRCHQESVAATILGNSGNRHVPP